MDWMLECGRALVKVPHMLVPGTYQKLFVKVLVMTPEKVLATGRL